MKSINAILINNYYEWIEVQNCLFKIGYQWRISGKELIKLNRDKYNELLIILSGNNHIDPRGNFILSWGFADLTNSIRMNYKIVDASVFLRREKLNRLKE